MTGSPGTLQPSVPGPFQGENPPPGYDPALYQVADSKVAGRSNLYIGTGEEEGGSLYYFGEQTDDTPLNFRDFFNDVPGDSHGGAQGPPVDRQALGKIATASFTLSAWSHQVRHWVAQLNGVYATVGRIEDYEIGTLMFRFHSFRVLIVPTRWNRTVANPLDKSADYFTYNFVNAHLSSPIEVATGSKFSALRFTMEAHRAHPAHPKRGTIWDKDITGLTQAQERQEAQLAAQMQAVRGVIPEPAS